jgi:hypothetical protein
MRTDLARIGLPLQVAGFIAALVALFFATAPHWIFAAAFAVHFAGDGLFFFQMKRQGCL